MNAGLVTFYHIHHYGALLQAAATQRAVEGLGGRCEIVDYFVNQDNRLFHPPVRPAAAASDAHTALHYRRLRDRWRRFEAFSQARLNISPRRFRSLEELRESDLPYDLILSGSDQIWNPLIFPDRRFDPVFFGAFSDCRKIAYAPSFGLPRIPEGMDGELREYLSAFTHLSARERQGRDIIRDLTGQEVPVVLDPTLLLTAGQWSAMAESVRRKEGGYILCYCVSRPGALTHYIQQLAAVTGLPVVQLCGARRKAHPKARLVLDAGPAEFLDWFRGASYVCTNSFHGAVFSVQFQRPFFASLSPGELAEPERSRTFSLLDRLGLTNRIIGRGGTAELLEPVDWERAGTRLEAARRDSLAYLNAALYNKPYSAEDRRDAAPPQGETCSEAEGAEGRRAAKTNRIPRLAEEGSCTGCTACQSICPKGAISMVRDREGFAYPKIDPERCVRCGRCTAVCPALKPRAERPRSLPAAFAAWNKNGEVRRDSTSGGVFSALAEDVLEGGGMVFGAALDGKQHLHHIACFRKEDLWRLRGAKYVQSDLGETFREIKEALKTRPVLFSGTPCQVDGLYQYLGGRPENLITCDLVCQGVPSPGVWEDMARLIEERKGRSLQTVRFRNKVEGWKNSHFTAVFADGGVDSRPLFSTEYGRAFGRALFLRPCCYRCPYAGLNRPGDFTLGDFWGLEPGELPEQQVWGVSLLLVNTAQGSHMFDRLPLERQPFPVERAIAGNPRLVSPIARPAERSAFFAAYALEPFQQVLREYCALPPLPVRAASKVLSPELKAKLKSLLK